MGDFQKAMIDCDESLVAQPSKEGYSLRGELWLQLDNPGQAIEDFETAGRFDDQVAQAYEKRAEKRRVAGETAEADADTAKAKELRDAMATKPATEKGPTSSAEGFDPANSVQ